jgi:hypothetical protein
MIDVASGSLRRTLPFSYRGVVVAILLVILAGDVVCWAAAEHLGASKSTMSNVFVVISTSSIVAVLLLPWLNLRGQELWNHKQRMEKMAYSWLVVLAVAHLTWELPWVLFHRYIMGVAGQGKLWSYLWWIYADGGDTRYIHPDANLLAMETVASILGATALVLVYLRHKSGRFTDHQLVAVMALMTCEFYSTIVYIVSESYRRFHDVTGGAGNFIVKFGYGNVLWLIVPCVVFFWAIQTILSRRDTLVERGTSSTVEPASGVLPQVAAQSFSSSLHSE